LMAMDKRKFIAKAVTPALLSAIVLIVFSSVAQAQEYGGTVPANLSTTQPPEIMFVSKGGYFYGIYSDPIDNDSFLNSGQLNVLAEVGHGDAYLFYIYTISYKASWENETIVAYQSDRNPTLIGGIGDRFSSVNCSITNIPPGPQQIELTATEGGVYFLTLGTFYTFSLNSTSTLRFTVLPPTPMPTATPSPTPTPTSTPPLTAQPTPTPSNSPSEQPTTEPTQTPTDENRQNWIPYALIVAGIIVLVAGSLVYLKTRKKK
jgi:hypothetical protein